TSRYSTQRRFYFRRKSMPTLMPQDANQFPIPALRLKQGGAQSIAAGSSSARNSVAFAADTRVVSVYATVPVYVHFGDSTVTAPSSSHFFPHGVYYDFSIGGNEQAHYDHIAVLQVSSAGTVYISEKE